MNIFKKILTLRSQKNNLKDVETTISQNIVETSQTFIKNKKRKKLELIFAFFMTLGIAIITWVQLAFFDSNSWLFFILINTNLILMLVVLALVARNVITLIIERKRKIFGSRLRTRLVLSFISISLIPILIMFLATNKILTTSVNFWFSSQVETSMEAALEVGQSFYTAAVNRIKENTKHYVKELHALPQDQWENVIRQYHKNYGLTMIGVMKNTENTIDNAPITEYILISNQTFKAIWKTARHSINLENINKTGFDSFLWQDSEGDYVICLFPLDENGENYLVIAETIGRGLLTQLKKISVGLEEYMELQNLKHPLKLSFSLILGLLSLLVLFGSIWLAFRMSRELTEPILALSKGTAQIAQGDWNFHVNDIGKDEIGQLVNSFNAMTTEIRENQERLTKMNWLIEERNEILIERNQYIETVLENITTGIATLDDKGTILTLNKASCNIFNIHAEQVEGLSLKIILPKEYLPMTENMYEFIQNNPKKTWAQEIDFIHQEQYSKIFVQAVALPTFIKNTFEDNPKNEHLNEPLIESTLQSKPYPQGRIILVIEDITELSQEQRLAAWREVAKRIAHEIKNPLTPIKLSAQRMQRKFASAVEDPVFSQCTNLIIKEVERMESMVADFSTFASLPTITLHEQNLPPIIQELVNLFKISHSFIEWQFHYNDNIPPLMLDKKAMHRALFNILSNAADAIHGLQKANETIEIKGLVEINVFHEIPETPLQKTRSFVAIDEDTDANIKNKEFVIIEITDNGQGFDKEETARLFEPYFSKKPTGTGLGLAIVHSIIADHHGNITAHSLDNTTRIRITLPVEHAKQIEDKG